VIAAGVASAKVIVVGEENVGAYVVLPTTEPASLTVTVQVPAMLAVTVVPPPVIWQLAVPALVTA